jgi:hypothetical protein
MNVSPASAVTVTLPGTPERAKPSICRSNGVELVDHCGDRQQGARTATAAVAQPRGGVGERVGTEPSREKATMAFSSELR